ncbi:MAG: hydantoinase/oxoprolinase family protein [Candidatus Adiutrix sp.]|jgi:N-methylhydantoinase A/oxoprolinase/acetone carboxylase beta subunit|nr:hydantoinase/oxoprolinase family protein [Candidatus Adiutrix sp.]
MATSAQFPARRPLILGLDTGGTHTDAVVYDPGPGRVLATAKALTTHHDLAIGLIGALNKISALHWAGGLPAIGLVNLSTTLATNAVAEGLGGRIGLVLIGYEQGRAVTSGLTRDLNRAQPVFVTGGHDYYGRPRADLDTRALRDQVEKLDPEVEAWAVSGFFSVKNPQHEMEAANIIRGLSRAPVTLGRDLTGQLDAVRRAATAALNAGLVLIVNRLLDAVKKALKELGLTARLMVVRGDGSLVAEDWARARPIETLVSGPAAGLVGAKELTRGLMGSEPTDLWVMDVGGTTTDLARLDQGRPAITPDGARIGPWRTMTEAVDTRTRALGGDSLVTVDRSGEITLGPRRVLPLCRLASIWPDLEKHLERAARLPLPPEQVTCFFLPGAPPGPGLSDTEALILEGLKTRSPYPLADLIQTLALTRGHFGGLKTLTHPAVLPAAFTPTDAMAVLGLFNGGSAVAAVAAAAALAKPLQLSPEDLCRRILDEFGRLLAEEIVTHAVHLAGLDLPDGIFGGQGLLGGALVRRPASAVIEFAFKIKTPLALMGAPAAALTPWLDKYLGSRIMVPPAFDVASAVGAATAPIQLRRQVELHTLPGFSGYRIFLPDGMLESADPEELVEKARRLMTDHMADLIRLAGGENPEIDCDRQDRRVILRDGSKLFLGSSLTFTARAGQ